MATVRSAAATDIPTVLAFIGKKADFDRAIGAFHGQVLTSAQHLHTALFGTPTFASALLLEDRGDPVGFAFYHFRFSSFAGRPSLWLDDLYIDAARRRGGGGQRLMHRLATIATGVDCTHLGWTADDRNVSGMSFYRKLGATEVDTRGHSVTWRMAPDAVLAATGSADRA